MTESHRRRISENMSRIQRSKSREDLSAQSSRLREARNLRQSPRTDGEALEARERKSQISKSLKTIDAVRTEKAKARHREVCASRSHLDADGSRFAVSLVADGFSCGDVAWLLKVSKDVVRRRVRLARSEGLSG